MLTGYYKKTNKKKQQQKQGNASSKMACERYQNLSEKEKNKIHRYGREHYKNLP